MDRIAEYEKRLDRTLQAALPSAAATPAHLHETMRTAIPRIGERTGALLVYAAGEAVRAPPEFLDAPAVAVELIHAFLHIHHGLGSAGRRSEAIAILAADALQPLAFQVLATAPALQARPSAQTYMVGLLAEACGANGLAGGRSLYLGNAMPDRAELEHSYRLRPGRLIRASVLCAAACARGTGEQELHALERFSDALGIGSRISRDLEEWRAGTARADAITYPGRFGAAEAQARCAALARTALAAIDGFGARAEGLRTMLRNLIAPAGQASAAGS
jgi:farnesyl diphosphate synthase